MSFLVTSSNRDRRLANETSRRPALIVAGPGARRPLTLVERVVDLVQNHGASPESLLVLTLTDDDAREFTTRLRNRLAALGIRFNVNLLQAGTFHSLCLRWLDQHRQFTRLKRNYTVMDQFDQHYFLYQRLDDYRAIVGSDSVLGKDATLWNQAQNLLKRLNAVTEQALDANQLVAKSDADGRTLANCYKRYIEHLEKANALDFSTIQLETLRLLENNPDVLATLRNRLAYLIVDGYPERSTIEQRIFRCLVDERRSQAAIGDPDRGAVHAESNESRPQLDDGYAQLVGLSPVETMPWWLLT